MTTNNPVEPSDAMLPCPFCGSPGQLFQRWKPVPGQRDDAYTMARCTNGSCGIQLDPPERTPKACVAAWNTRPAMQSAASPVGDEVREMHDRLRAWSNDPDDEPPIKLMQVAADLLSRFEERK